MKRLVLASASPRRADLLRQLGIPFEVVASGIAEALPPGSVREAVEALALAKARAVAGRVGSAVVLGADTAVVLAGQVFGKPESPEDARGMLRALRGREHEVVTGVALVEASGTRGGHPGEGVAPVGGREETAAVVSRVLMREYSDAEIEAYVGSGEPFDKAGGYAVQAGGGALVAKVEGCYTNVVGLPLTTTRRLLESWGLYSVTRA